MLERLHYQKASWAKLSRVERIEAKKAPLLKSARKTQNKTKQYKETYGRIRKEPSN